MSPGLVIFDIGSTLVMGPTDGPAARIATRLGLDAEQQKVLHDTLMTRRFDTPGDVCAFLQDAFDEASSRTLPVVEEVWGEQEHDAQPIPGAAEVLTRLEQEDVRLCLLSNIWQPYLTSVRRYFGAFFDKSIPSSLQVLSFRVGDAKPLLGIFETALRAGGVSPGEAVMVGDSYTEDIRPAATLGMRTIWLLHRPEKETDAIVRVLNRGSQPPTCTLRSITELTVELASPTHDRTRRSAASAHILG